MLLLNRAAMILKPTKRTTPDQWARENRVYPASAGVPGPRDPSLTPYIIPVERAVASQQYRRVVFVCGAQMGKTDAELDLIGHRLDQSPVPIIFAGPNKQFLHEQFEPRLMKLLNEAPILQEKVARGKKMTKTRKVIAGVPIRLAHGGSSTALKSDPAGFAIIDEYDEMLANVKGQGDPLVLVEARGVTYSDSFTTMVSSTPSVGSTDIEGDVKGLQFWKFTDPDEMESGVWKLWQEGTRFHWSWPCPSCGDFFIPRFQNLRWPDKASPAEARRAAFVLCPHCGGVIDDSAKKEMNAKGTYLAPTQTVDRFGNVSGEPPESSTASYWVSGLASPFATFGERAEKFLLASGTKDRHKTQSVINSAFGELWSPGGGEVPAHDEIKKLILPYSMDQVPVGVIALTCGVDVQKNRLVYVIRGWGSRATSWLIKYGELWGNTSEPEVWSALDDLLNQRWAGLYIRLCLIDSGFRPNKKDAGPEHVVYEFCRLHQRQCRPSKGYDVLKSGAVSLSKIEINSKDGKGAKYGLELVRVNSDWCKLWVHERIRWPQDQPGAFHLPSDINDDYCMQLVSEARLKKPSGRAEWVQKTRDNHALDCEAMAYAAGYLLNVQRIAGEAPDHSAGVAVAVEGVPEPAVINSAAQQQTVRRGTPSSFVRR